MKLIGITGKSGSGKTTLSDMIAEKQDVEVIHIDKLINKIKEENLFQVMECDNKGNPIGVKKSIRRFLYTNKQIFLLYIKIKGILLNIIIENKIEQLENQGKNVVVIEGTHLRYYPIFKKLDKRVMVKRPFIERQKSVLERDISKKVDKEVFVMWDMPYKRSYYKEKIEEYDYKIDNVSKEQLRQEANMIYKDISGLTEKEKRRQKFEKYKCRVNSVEIHRNNNEKTIGECIYNEAR